jgi:Kef-type K+ transport system membrane component KefB
VSEAVQHLFEQPLARFIAQIIAVILASRLVAVVIRRLAQPMVIAEMVGGIILGPSLFGWLAPGLWSQIFRPDSLTTLQLISQFGLVLFMCLVGVELNPAHFRRASWTSVVIAQSGIIIPFALGGALAFWLYPEYGNPSVPRPVFVMFAGAAMSVTAFPVLARIIRETGLQHSRIGAITLVCAAIDDVTAWCILAFIVGIAGQRDISGATWTVVATVIYVIVMIGVVRPLLSRFGARVSSPESPPPSLVALLITLLLVSSWATERIGIHGLFGGFLFGAILPKDRGLAQAFARRLETVVEVVFLPLFFASSGLNTRIGLLASGRDWAVAGAVVLVASAGKLGGCSLAAWLTGHRGRDAITLGVLMNTRGLMELIVLNIGLGMGVISPTVFSMMVIMALVTTCIASPLVRRFPPSR